MPTTAISSLILTKAPCNERIAEACAGLVRTLLAELQEAETYVKRVDDRKQLFDL